MAEKALEVNDLGVSFGEEVILKNLSFEVSKGESIAIIGPNGSGKTTLFKCLLGSISYKKGEIKWGENIKLGYVPQRIDLERSLTTTLKDFLNLKCDISKINRSHIFDALKLVHLSSDKLSRPLAKLSGGELQRALIAFALIGDANLLLFDEPTSGVDLPGEEQIYQTLHHLQDEKGFTLIFISHDLNLVHRYADKVVCLNKTLSCVGEPGSTLTPEILDKLYGSKTMHHFHDLDKSNH